MASIEYKKQFTVPAQEIKQAIEALAENLKQEQGMSYHWQNDQRVEFTHKAGKGFIQINANEVCLQLKLGMMYSAMAPLLRSKIKEAADRYIH